MSDALRELLEDYYDDRRCYRALLSLYHSKMMQGYESCKAWRNMYDDLRKKIEELDIDIQYVEKTLNND